DDAVRSRAMTGKAAAEAAAAAAVAEAATTAPIATSASGAVAVTGPAAASAAASGPGEEPFILAGNPLADRFRRHGEEAALAWAVAQSVWSRRELAGRSEEHTSELQSRQ